MEKLYSVIFFSYICLVAYIIIGLGEASNDTQLLHRQKRYLTFPNITHFFLRVNFKANMVPWNQIFAQAAGFRINWDEPPDSYHPYHHFNRRSVYSNLEILLDRNGLNGFHCVRRAICDMEQISEPREIYQRILKMVFREHSAATAKWHATSGEECLLSLSLCPLSVLDVSQFTDIV